MNDYNQDETSSSKDKIQALELKEDTPHHSNHKDDLALWSSFSAI